MKGSENMSKRVVSKVLILFLIFVILIFINTFINKSGLNSEQSIDTDKIENSDSAPPNIEQEDNSIPDTDSNDDVNKNTEYELIELQ